jgi:methionyl-tRNA formyltransferase
LIPEPQDDALATVSGRVEKEDGRVDWSRPAEVLWRMSRAYDPWPGLFAFLNEQRVRLWVVSPLPDWQGDALPGEVIRELENELAVATGRGALILEEVQLAGRKRISGPDFLRGQRETRFFS